MELTYSTIEEQLADALPEIRPAAERYWDIQGYPGHDPGPYIFFEDMFGCYIEVLLALRPSAARDRLLRRGFGFVEAMLASRDLNVGNLAYVGLLEGRDAWWIDRALDFIGPQGRAALDKYDPEWRSLSSRSVATSELSGRDISDLYDVRYVIASELASEGLRPEDVPGVT